MKPKKLNQKKRHNNHSSEEEHFKPFFEVSEKEFQKNRQYSKESREEESFSVEPIAALKRSQTQKKEVEDPGPYKTQYQLWPMDEKDYDKVITCLEHHHLEYDSEFSVFLRDTYVERHDWDVRIERDLRSFSRKCPDVLFHVRSQGSDFGDARAYWAREGRFYSEPIRPSHFDYTKLC